MGIIRDSWVSHCRGDYRRQFGDPVRVYTAIGNFERLERLIRSRCPDRPCYVSVYAFEIYEGNPLYRSAVINTSFFDFDCKENPQLAFNDALKFYREMDRRRIKPRLYFSGSKGIAAYLDFEPVALEPWLKRLALESFQRNLMHKLNIGTMDTQPIGDLARISRIPNTKHQSSGLWCIPVTIDEIEKGVEYVKGLATAPRRLQIEINSDNSMPEVLIRFAKHIEHRTEIERLIGKAKKLLDALTAKKKHGHVRWIDSDKVKANNTLASVMGTNEQMIKCPFHNDHNPSLHIDHNKQLWYCFGCKKGGDVISYVMYRDHVDFIEALWKLS